MIRIGIAGYGNLGRGVESALSHTEDMELVGVFTRRSPDSVKTKTGVPVYSMEQAKNMTDKIDVMILCGGSANDLPKQTAELAHAREDPGAFCGRRRGLQEERPPRHDFRRLGPGYVLPEPPLWSGDFAERQRLHVLGQGCQPGSLRCDSPHSRRTGCPPVYYPGGERA